MKAKTKVLSILLAAVMLLGILPIGMLTASATGTETTIPTMPTSYPDGAVTNLQNLRTSVLMDFDEETGNVKGAQNTDIATVTDGKWVTNIENLDTYTWAKNGNGDSASNPTYSIKNTLGASGLLFYLEVEDGAYETTSPNFNFRLRVTAKRTASNTDNTPDFILGAKESLNSSPVGADECVYYTYKNGSWTKQTNTSYYVGSAVGSAWYYIPFSAFYYLQHRTSVSRAYADEAFAMSLAEFAERYNGSGAFTIDNISIRQGKGSTQTSPLYFHDVYMVYPELEAASESAATTELLPDLKISNLNEFPTTTVEGATASITDGVLTVGGALTNNSTSTSNQRVWLGSNTSATVDVSNATGIRFHVNTTDLGDSEEDGHLILRLRLKDSAEPETVDYKLLTNAEYKTIKELEDAASGNNYSTPQYTMNTANSTAFLYDESGNLVPCYGSNVGGTLNNHADYIMIPAGYDGDVYIPMRSYYCHLGGSWTAFPVVSFDKAVSLGLLQKIDQISLIQGYTETDTTKTKDFTVTYSNFELVYDELEVTETAVSVGNDLALKARVASTDGATVTSASYVMDGTTYDATVSGNTADGYVVTCDGILPQDAGKDMTILLNGTVNGASITATAARTSVKDYCLKLIDDDTASAAAKNVAADLLRYAFAAQLFVAGDELMSDAPILTDTINGTIATLGTPYDSATIPTNTSVKSTSTAQGYDITSASLRLENALALKLNVAVPESGAAVVGFTLGEDDEVRVDVTDGAAAFSVGAADFNTVITVKLYVENAEVQTLTYKVNDYFAEALVDTTLNEYETTLVKALYCYGVSATAYAQSLSSN